MSDEKKVIIIAGPNGAGDDALWNEGATDERHRNL